MRKQNKVSIWSVYFDATKTRREGRRIPKKLAVASPKVEELQRAAKRLGLQPETMFDAAHPSSPWRKSGLLVILKKESKNKIVQKIAKELINLRR
jgi:signal recognition particle subunit SRP19